MFAGIDEVDWASMRHAYGSAERVPELLRGLASTDPAVREVALDRMYGGVHHQGDVYDSTLACIPFLFELVRNDLVQDRGEIVELLVSIGGGEGEGAEKDEDRGDDEDTEDPYLRAQAAVRAAGEVFAGLVADRDAGVRRAAAGALVRFLGKPARVLGLVQERIAVERDDRVRLALVESLGRFVQRYPQHAADAVDLLVGLSAPASDPGLRLAALGQLAGCASDRLPADLLPTVVELMKERSERRPGHPDEPRGAGTDTLVGHLRRLEPPDRDGMQLLWTSTRPWRTG